MATRIYDKIQLPTNSTDIATLVRYLKGIKKHEPLNNDSAQPYYAHVKETGVRARSSGKKDTHTTLTLYTYGLIDYVDKKNFVVSPLGCELISLYDDLGVPLKDNEGKNQFSEETYTIILLKVFAAWHQVQKRFHRDIHPGRIILQLLCEPELEYYLTEHDLAYFTSNSAFKTDDQYEEIKAYILKNREQNEGICNLVQSCKAELFMPTLVRKWHILQKDEIFSVEDDTTMPGHYVLVQKTYVPNDEEENEEVTAETDETDSLDVATSEATVDAGGVSDDTAEEETTPESDSDIYRTLTHYVLTEGASVYCGMEYGYKLKPEQIVYFGAPGTGKSYALDKRLADESYKSRVIFYPDYTYGDFVGCLRPTKDAKIGVDYRFIAGPLTKALKTAFEHPKDKVYMIIEEINRGSAAAIFGDLFQLLDRDINGKSRYPVRNEEMCSIFTDSMLLNPFFADGNVWFPSNFSLVCTMNTADQNVFVLDSAFKRRFKMSYVPIDYNVFYSTEFLRDKRLAKYKEETEVFSGTADLRTLFSSTELDSVVNDLATKGRLKRNWPTFATLVNATIDIINKNEGDQISEDKKLGPFYILPEELNNKKDFADKVLYYLKQDVFKYVDTYFTLSYQGLYKGYVDGSIDVFELLIPGGL